jgi:hypothetical protein
MPIKLSIPLQGDGRIEIEGDFEYVKQNIPHMKEIVEALGTSKAFVTPIVTLEAELDQNAKPPRIPANLKNSPSNAIEYLFNNGSWGMKSRSSNDVMEALAEQGINRAIGFVSATLGQLVSASKLHRVKDKARNIWVYSKY